MIMFLEKIEQLARDWGKSMSDMEKIAQASLRYGMRLDRHPGRLKRELKKIQIDSTIATPLWSGNAYMLITMPEVLVNKKKKIPCLADFLFAKKALKKEDYKELRVKIKNIPKDTNTHDILIKMMPAIKRQAYCKGRFLPQFDRMYGGLEDIQQDLAIEALSVINKQITNLKSHEMDDIMKYMGYCFKKKSDTYIRANAPKVRRVQIEEEKHFEDLIQEHKVSEGEDYESEQEFGFKEVAHDLKSILGKESYLAVALLMNFATKQEAEPFDSYLAGLGLDRKEMTNTETKKQIERFLKKPDLFSQLQSSKVLIKYLKG